MYAMFFSTIFRKHNAVGAIMLLTVIEVWRAVRIMEGLEKECAFQGSKLQGTV